MRTFLKEGSAPLYQKFVRLENYAFAKIGETKGTLLTIEEECYNPMLAFSLFHMYIRSKKIIVKILKKWALRRHFIQPSLLSCSFRTALLHTSMLLALNLTKCLDKIFSIRCKEGACLHHIRPKFTNMHLKV